MKRVFVGIFTLIAAMFLASCSQYTCPTYTRHSPPEHLQHTIPVKTS